MPKRSCLTDAYRFSGFTPKASLKGIFGDAFARVVTLVRRQKKQLAVLAASITTAFTTRRLVGFAIYPVVGIASTWISRFVESSVVGAVK